MALIATEGTKRTPAPEGTHLALCCQIIDIGTQHSEYYGTDSHKVVFGWELPNELNPEDENKPFLVWKRYTLSLNEKAALRAHLESWRGKKFSDEELRGFDLKNVLGKPCLLNVVHSEGYANVAAVMAVTKGTPIPKPSHTQIFFDIDEWNDEVFKTFSPKMQQTISNSKEAIDKFGQRANGAAPAEINLDDDAIPF